MRSSMSAAAALASVLALATASTVFAQSRAAGSAEVGLPFLALNVIPLSRAAKLSVSSPAFRNNADIPFKNTMYRTNTFPGLSWSAGPTGTKSFVVILQDADGLIQNAPVLHWSLYNIPPTVTSLVAGMTAPPAGASYGPNLCGPAEPYMGPHAPAGPKHHYHFQVFALDTTIVAGPTLTYAELLVAMTGHVVAAGQSIGMSTLDPNPTAPPLLSCPTSHDGARSAR